MPRSSKRQKFIKELTSIFKWRLGQRLARLLFEDEPDDIEDAIDYVVAVSLSKATKKRYIFRRHKYRVKKAERVFKEDLQVDGAEATDMSNAASTSPSEIPWLNDEEFLQKYRMSRACFNRVLALIKDHPVFHSKTKDQAPVEYQLMTWLKFAGTEGSGSSNANQRNMFKIGYGTADTYRTRVTTALCSLAPAYYKWPDPEERLVIAREILREFQFPHCVGITDGTLFPLAFEPETEDAPDYSGRKGGYSLSTIIICDHRRRIRHYLAGFPGSAHDNRIFKATKLFQKPEQYFSDREYLIGDSAFENSSFMVSAFKKPKGEVIPKQHEKFNEKLAQLRVISEHTIGILKGRFPWLRSIRLKIKEDEQTIRNILKMLKATVVLHNMLIEFGEETQEEWILDDDASDIDDAERAPYEEGDALNTAIPGGAAKDERRTRLMYYFEEYHYFVE